MDKTRRIDVKVDGSISSDSSYILHEVINDAGFITEIVICPTNIEDLNWTEKGIKENTMIVKDDLNGNLKIKIGTKKLDVDVCDLELLFLLFKVQEANTKFRTRVYEVEYKQTEL